ncbi:MAG: hypothetical protein H0W76_27680 [Pyrinomonadaceae bacterium]|nr:hypothetical protein [Pyrinomonadaceae bacterium]
MINSLHSHATDAASTTTETAVRDAAETNKSLARWLKNEKILLLILIALTVITWLPRLKGPIDLRWDGGVYYILGTALAEGKGYKLLNEPGEIEAVQYPPLLPAIIAGYQLVLGTDDPTTVGQWLRFSAFIIFIVYICVTYRFFKNHLSSRYAFLATLLCLFSLHVYFLSDLLFPEIPFSLVTVLFVLCHRKEDKSRVYSVLTYLFAVASFALRTVGMAAFAAWVLESLVRSRFKQAALRAVLVLIPILCWQFYIASVESSYAYNHPAYAYQRAPYMFYNVTYARNISLRDPFTPEKGVTSPAKIVRRVVRNATYIPLNIAEALSTSRGYWESWWRLLLGEATIIQFIISWSIFLILYVFGFFVLGGLALQLLRRQRIVPLYGSIYLAALCLTPFPQQYLRYLMPVVPFLVLSLIVFLSAARDASHRFLPSQWTNFGTYFTVATLSIALLAEILCFITNYTQYHERIAYLDRQHQPVEYRLFFYNKSYQAFDASVSYVRQQAKPDDVVAAGLPHWVYLRTGLKTVMPPFEKDAVTAQQLLDSVPVSYLIICQDVIGSERYTLPVVRQFTDQWRQIYSTPEGDCAVYQRANRQRVADQ